MSKPLTLSPQSYKVNPTNIKIKHYRKLVVSLLTKSKTT